VGFLSVSRNKDMLYLANNSASFLKTLCEKAGLIAAPSA
jgi:hypothetical protein